MNLSSRLSFVWCLFEYETCLPICKGVMHHILYMSSIQYAASMIRGSMLSVGCKKLAAADCETSGPAEGWLLLVLGQFQTGVLIT